MKTRYYDPYPWPGQSPWCWPAAHTVCSGCVCPCHAPGIVETDTTVPEEDPMSLFEEIKDLVAPLFTHEDPLVAEAAAAVSGKVDELKARAEADLKALEAKTAAAVTTAAQPADGLVAVRLSPAQNEQLLAILNGTAAAPPPAVPAGPALSAAERAGAAARGETV